jgi:hypothetical protein
MAANAGTKQAEPEKAAGSLYEAPVPEVYCPQHPAYRHSHAITLMLISAVPAEIAGMLRHTVLYRKNMK